MTTRTPTDATQRAREWASTMGGHRSGRVDEPAVRRAHADSAGSGTLLAATLDREAREEVEDRLLAPGATRARGAGERAVEEEPDPQRTCFERDRDRILHSTAFRRLAGKTQVFVFPDDHQRTRLTHALEVAQVATAIARAVGLNVALTEAIALGHDCGHGPGGHASEDAFSPYVEGGYDHAVWGADTVLAPLNLCAQTLDGIRNHSWSRPAPSTPEGEVVSWADRIAYVCHDFEDAVHAGIVAPHQLPSVVLERCGDRRSRQLHAFIDGVTSAVRATGSVAMTEPMAEALAEFRRFNYEHIYMRPESRAQSAAVVRVLRALVEHHAEHPELIPRPAPDGGPLEPGGEAARREAVTWVGGMTDRYAFDKAIRLLGWRQEDLPVGIG
ncbi:MAG TPA: HD domain-containing protein [Microthrixaceae bacterium]|nr:HD domain-containing protein [Microthrixaceae bacterium]